MKVPLFQIYWDEEDVDAVRSTIMKGSSWANGPKVKEFEERIAEYIGSDHCVVFNSATSALHASLLANDIGIGDEVIVPSFTFIATANAPLFTGAKPVFADIERERMGLDPAAVANAITNETRAIIPVHYGGCPCRIAELREIADDNDLVLIEDAAGAMGATIGDRKVGTFGDMAVLSFCQNKIISTGEGGAVVTNSREISRKLKLIRSHGRDESEDHFMTGKFQDNISLGYNFRMSDITASLGISQLNKIDKLISMRRAVADSYHSRLSKNDRIEPIRTPTDSLNVYQLLSIIVKEGKQTRDKLIIDLQKKGISSKVYFYPIHLTQFYRRTFGYEEGDLPVTESISNSILSLPIYPTLQDEVIDYVVEMMIQAIEH